MGEVKLTKAQRAALKYLMGGDASAYAMQGSVGTLNALSLKGLVVLLNEPGAMAFPRTAKWRITPAGREALAAAEGREDG